MPPQICALTACWFQLALRLCLVVAQLPVRLPQLRGRRPVPSCTQWYGFHVNIQAAGLVQQQAALQIYLAVGQLPGSGWKGLAAKV